MQSHSFFLKVESYELTSWQSQIWHHQRWWWSLKNQQLIHWTATCFRLNWHHITQEQTSASQAVFCEKSSHVWHVSITFKLKWKVSLIWASRQSLSISLYLQLDYSYLIIFTTNTCFRKSVFKYHFWSVWSHNHCCNNVFHTERLHHLCRSNYWQHYHKQIFQLHVRNHDIWHRNRQSKLFFIKIMREFTSKECVLQLINSWDHQYQWHWQNLDYHSSVTFQCHFDTSVSIIRLRQFTLYYLNEAILLWRFLSWFSTAARFNVYTAALI